MNRYTFIIAAAAGIAATSLAACAEAQDARPKGAITSEKIAPGIAVLYGEGGNIGLSYGEDGTVMIDDKFARSSDAIKAAVKELGADPVKFLINTHWHGDHTGGNENFGQDGSTIIAHDNVRSRLKNRRKGTRPVKPAPKISLPIVTYDGGLKLHLNGEELHLISVQPAHTDGDSIIHWPKSNIIHMGDTFFNKVTYPFIDLNSGGSIAGAIEAVNKALLLADENTKIIPGHGKMATKQDLQDYKKMLTEITGKIEAGMARGKSLDEIKALRPADGYGVNPKAFITPDRFVETVYTDLKARLSASK